MKQNYSFYILISVVLAFTTTAQKLFAQPFKLTDIYSNQFSLDRLNQQVYFKDYLTDTVRTVDLKTMDVTKTKFLYYSPVISNKFNYVVYVDTLYDLNNNMQYPFKRENKDSLLYSPNSVFQGAFSPNDSVYMFGNPKYYIPLDNLSALEPIETGFSVYGKVDYYNDCWPRWSSDSSFIFKSGDTVMVEFFLKSKESDTLTITQSIITGWSYNPEYNILAYSIDWDAEEFPKIYFHYPNSEKDSLVFSPERDDSASIPSWESGYQIIRSLCWSPDNKKLAFLAFQYVDISAAEVYVYSLDSNRTYKYETDDVNYGGLKYHLKWANNDTLVYANETDKFLYGLDVSSVITSVEDCREDNSISYGFNISNYPNPFNPNTTISISLPVSERIKLVVYDILGRKVTELAEGLYKAGEYKFQFNASGIASGVYIYRLQTPSRTMSKKMMLLK